MKEKTNWIDVVLRFHEQSHLYWRTIFAIHLLVLGWVITITSIKPLFAWPIVFFVFAIQMLLTQAMMKFYNMIVAAIQEYKNENTENEKTPFLAAINNMFLLTSWQLGGINMLLTLILTLVILGKAYVFQGIESEIEIEIYNIKKSSRV